jgi:hypothetical protein
MKRLFGGLALVAVLVGVTAQSAAAQLHGNVVWGTKPGPGVTIYGDFATALNDDAKVGGETPSGAWTSHLLGVGRVRIVQSGRRQR